MTITEHAYDRAKERLSWNKETLDRMSEKALKEGIKHSDTKGHLNKYITKEYFKYKIANNVRVHGEVVYFFNNDTLITLYRIPNELKKLVKICRDKKS